MALFERFKNIFSQKPIIPPRPRQSTKHIAGRGTVIKGQTQNINLIQLVDISQSENVWHPTFISESIQHYLEASPVFSAIDLIASEFSTLKVKVWDSSERDFVEDHPSLALLKMPNPMDSEKSFLYALATYFLVTGNSFLVATGNIAQPPLEISNSNPRQITIQGDTTGIPQTIQVITGMGQIQFQKTLVFEVLGAGAVDQFGSIRFYNDKKREIWHSRQFNPLSDGFQRNFFGLSKLTPLFYEIQQFLQASIHNWSLLKRGARPSGAMVAEGNLTQPQFDKLQEEINNELSGSENTGRPLVLDGGVKWEEMSVSNKDMDFFALKQNVTNAIFNVYKIPLPLINADQMTLSNMETSKLNLYDNAVIPLANFLLSELTRFIMPRYPNSETFEFTFDQGDISALQSRKVDNVLNLSKAGIMTTNELRAILGKESLEGGDDVLLPANLLPLLRDAFTEDNPETPRPRTAKKQCRELLQQQKDEQGNPYSKEAIEKILKQVFD